jgi:N-acetylglucosamine-6-sulfatase
MMRHRGRMQTSSLCAVAIALGMAAAPQAVFALGPCAQIRAACLQAGFVQGSAKEGTGLQVDCVRPIMQGSAQPNRASKPLPQVDPRVVAACKAMRPGSEAMAPPSQTGGELPLPASAPPPVAVAPSTPARALSTSGRRPNIVFVLTDDLSWNLVQYMPHVLQMQKDGVTFTNYFVTDSLCCPSRSSIFTGRYPHNTGIFRNVGEDGGYLGFHRRGHEQATFASALPATGYRLAMLGKYLNGYQPRLHPVAPGWTFWAVAGNGYPGFNYDLNQDGRLIRYGARPTDYMTDVLSGLAVGFIKQQAGTPFVIEIATFAPHAPYTPAPRDADALAGLRAPRTPAFNAAPDANAPPWLKAHRALSDADMGEIDRDFRKRAQSVLAVDTMIGQLQAALGAIGEAGNTYFVFSSDNGYHMGEHRLMPGKMTAFDTDIHVPLIVTGPGVPAGTMVEEIVENIDLCPTFTELGGMVTATSIDGRSLVPLLHRQKVADWRTVALVEHRGPVRNLVDPDLPSARSGNPTTYEAIRGLKSLYIEYANGDKEYHDLAADPDELRNSFSSLSSKQQTALHVTLDAIRSCHGAQSCSAAARPDRTLTQR